jgi:hypothetical protein
MKGAWVRGNVDLQMYNSLSENDIDVVYFDSILGQKAFVSGSINVRMGGGDDMVFSTSPLYGDLQVWALGVHSLGSMTIDLGAGNDTAYLRNLRVGGNLVVWGGAGADSVEMRQTPIDGEFGIAAAVNGDMYMQMYASASEMDADSITTNAVGINGGFTALLGAGNDTLRLTDFTSFRTINLDAGAGNDAVDLVRTMAVENFFAALGEGDDSLNIVDLFQPVGLTRIDGGAGYDRLNKSGAFPAARVEQTGWEVINGRRQDLLAIKVGTFTMR